MSLRFNRLARLGILAAALAASAFSARRNRQYTMERLKPPVEV